MKLKWLYFLGFYLIGIGLISSSFDTPLVTSDSSNFVSSSTDILSPFGFELGINLSDKARAGRTQVSIFPRQKGDRSDRLEDPGLIFLSCRLSRSYSASDNDKYYLQLIGRSIQVNAP